MKFINYKLNFFLFIIINCNLFLSCKSKPSPIRTNNDSTVPNANKSQSANQLYSEGMKILDDRIAIQSSDKEKAMELNKKAIEKFTAAYKIDTSLTDPILFASECTMYARDYQNCIYWTTKLMNIDTTQQNISFCIDRIGYCNKQLSIKHVN